MWFQRLRVVLRVTRGSALGDGRKQPYGDVADVRRNTDGRLHDHPDVIENLVLADIEVDGDVIDHVADVYVDETGCAEPVTAIPIANAMPRKERTTQLFDISTLLDQ
jgi:hypothetical protein